MRELVGGPHAEAGVHHLDTNAPNPTKPENGVGSECFATSGDYIPECDGVDGSLLWFPRLIVC